MTYKYKAVKNCISKLCGESSLKVYYILPEGFNCWWTPTEPSRKGCDGKTISARQKFILSPCWLTEAPPRVVTDFLSTQNKPVYSLVSRTAGGCRIDSECYQFLSNWVAITAEGSFCSSVAIHDCLFLAPHTSSPSCTSTANHGALLQTEPVEAGLCPCVVLPTFSSLAWYKPKPAWSLRNMSPAVFPPPPCRLGSSSIWKRTQQSKQKALGIACRFSIKLLFWMANLIFFLIEVAVS